MSPQHGHSIRQPIYTVWFGGRPGTVVALLVHTIHQTTVFIAQLTISRGVRAPLAQVAKQVFLDWFVGLEQQGVSRKASVDDASFGTLCKVTPRNGEQRSMASKMIVKTFAKCTLPGMAGLIRPPGTRENLPNDCVYSFSSAKRTTANVRQNIGSEQPGVRRPDSQNTDNVGRA